jgi:hypothetical protein
MSIANFLFGLPLASWEGRAERIGQRGESRFSGWTLSFGGVRAGSSADAAAAAGDGRAGLPGCRPNAEVATFEGDDVP